MLELDFDDVNTAPLFLLRCSLVSGIHHCGCVLVIFGMSITLSEVLNGAVEIPHRASVLLELFETMKEFSEEARHQTPDVRFRCHVYFT